MLATFRACLCVPVVSAVMFFLLGTSSPSSAITIVLNATIRHGGGDLRGSGRIDGTADFGIIDLEFHIKYFVCKEPKGECGGIIVGGGGRDITVDVTNAAPTSPAEQLLLSRIAQQVNAGKLSGRIVMGRASIEQVVAAEALTRALAQEISAQVRTGGQPLLSGGALGPASALAGAHFTFGVWDFYRHLPLIGVLEIRSSQ